jgi:hypothetical protein
MSSVPDDIAALVRSVAMTTPAPYGDTDAVYRRARRYRRRRAGAVACVAAFVGLSAAAIPALAGGRDPYVQPAMGPTWTPTSTPSASPHDVQVEVEHGSRGLPAGVVMRLQGLANPLPRPSWAR